ncbi:MAG: type II secretion system F family protein, partial [Meiothermus sp.]|nr:type II secretion system F family protein [Meiothermus sp.]
GEQGNAIPDLTEKYAQYLKEQVRRSVQQNSKLIEPALIVVMAVVVGGLILSLMVPFYDAINKIQQIR